MSSFAQAWLLSVTLPLTIACTNSAPRVSKPQEPYAQVSSTRTTRTEAEPAKVATLARRTGRGVPELLDDVEGKIAGLQRAEDALYLRIEVPEAGSLLGTAAGIDELVCESDVRCLGALRVPTPRVHRKPAPQRNVGGKPEGDGEAATELLLRLTDARAASQLRAVTVRSYREARGGIQRRIVVLPSAQPPREADLEREFAESWGNYLLNAAGDEPFATFAASRLRRRLASKGSPSAGPRSHSLTADLRALMDFYTGRAEVNRTLQVDRGLGVAARAVSPTIPLASLPGVQHEPRDYRAAMAGEVGASTFVPHPLSTLIPDDALVVEFASVRDLIKLPRHLDERLGLVLRALEGRPGDDWQFEKYANQLMLERTSLGEGLGHVAVGAVTLVIGDPYLREGTDVSLVFEVRDRNLLESTLSKFIAVARRARPDLETKETILAEHPVTLHATPDGQMRRYQSWVGSSLVVSNSPKAMVRILELQRSKSTSLVQSSDYRWARTLAPFVVEAERAFLFFGDAFVEKITGPRSKILESRRVRALAELRAVEYAALLFGWLRGTRPNAQEDLLASGWLFKSDLVHFDGSPIRFDPQNGASSRYGTAERLTPVVDMEIAKVGSDEAAAYAEFRANYERSLQGALDPTYLRIARTNSDDLLRTELRILPLNPSGEIGSQFRDIVRTAGRGAIDAGPGPSGIRAALGISRESPLRELANSALDGMLRSRELTLGFVGDWAEVGVMDDPWLWNFAVAEHVLPELDGPREMHPDFEVERNLHRIPAWAAIHVRSPMLLAAALTVLRAQSSERLGEWVTWRDAAKYRGINVTNVELRPNGATDGPLAIQFAVAADVMVLSLDRRILELQVDRVLAGQRPKSVAANTGQSQLVFTLENDKTHYLSDILAALLDAPALAAHRRACNGLKLLAGGYGEAVANSAERKQLGLRILGYSPESPAGPDLVIRQGQCHHPIYGSSFEPVLPSDGNNITAPLRAAIRALIAARFGVAVVPRAAEQEFVGRVELEWR